MQRASWDAQQLWGAVFAEEIKAKDARLYNVVWM